jgi:hypothetical protein
MMANPAPSPRFRTVLVAEALRHCIARSPIAADLPDWQKLPLEDLAARCISDAGLDLDRLWEGLQDLPGVSERGAAAVVAALAAHGAELPAAPREGPRLQALTAAQRQELLLACPVDREALAAAVRSARVRALAAALPSMGNPEHSGETVVQPQWTSAPAPASAPLPGPVTRPLPGPVTRPLPGPVTRPLPAQRPGWSARWLWLGLLALGLAGAAFAVLRGG